MTEVTHNSQLHMNEGSVVRAKIWHLQEELTEVTHNPQLHMKEGDVARAKV